MNLRAVFASFIAVLLVGCASVPMESKEASDKAKQFSAPTKGMAGVYVYRGGGPGTALKKDILIDGKCIGESAPNVFFYEEVAGNQEHTISTESEFSPNELKLNTLSDMLYFVRQYIKLGVFVGGANLEVVEEANGKKAIQELEMAQKGICGN